MSSGSWTKPSMCGSLFTPTTPRLQDLDHTIHGVVSLRTVKPINVIPTHLNMSAAALKKCRLRLST